jgi:hypothetical protein
MGSESPLHKALAAWRIAEHRLDETPPDDPRRASLRGEVERRRLLYKALYQAVEDVAGHGAPFTESPSPATRDQGQPTTS